MPQFRQQTKISKPAIKRVPKLRYLVTSQRDGIKMQQSGRCDDEAKSVTSFAWWRYPEGLDELIVAINSVPNGWSDGFIASSSPPMFIDEENIRFSTPFNPPNLLSRKDNTNPSVKKVDYANMGPTANEKNCLAVVGDGTRIPEIIFTFTCREFPEATCLLEDRVW